MTPKDKAVELVEKYGIWCWNDGVCDYELAKECALIAVNEILIIIFFDYDWQYWNEVKQELKKL